MIAKNLDEFTMKVTKSICEALNDGIGQELTKQLLMAKLAKNPNMSAEEWEKTKQEFVVFLFDSLLKADADLMNEMGEHTYNALRS